MADPICTLVFSAIVMATTVGVMRDAVQVLMEAAPPELQYRSVAGQARPAGGRALVLSLTEMVGACLVFPPLFTASVRFPCS